MQFESKRQRSLWIAVLLSTIPDIAISIASAWAYEGGVLGFFAVLIALQILYLILWIKNSLWAWLLFSYGGGRKTLASLFLDYLRANKYPEPDMYEKSADGYLGSVVDNEQLPVDVRLKAASELGAIKFVESSAQVQLSMRISMAYEDALEQFKQSFLSTTSIGELAKEGKAQ